MAIKLEKTQVRLWYMLLYRLKIVLTVNDTTLDAVSKIEDLRSNLKSFEFGNIRNRPMYRGSIHYMHEIEMSLKVFKSKLGEPA